MVTTSIAPRAGKLINLTGAGKAERETAFMAIAPLSFVENVSRAETLTNMRKALGKAPSEAMVALAKQEWQIGRIASRMTKADLPKGYNWTDTASRLEGARELLLNYAAAVKPGTKAGKLKAGKVGRRNPVQQKLVQAAWEASSKLMAELELGNAKTQAQADKAKSSRAPHHNDGGPNAADTDNMPKGGKGTADPKPTLGAAGPVKHKSAETACEYVEQMAATLLAFVNKNAALLPTDYGMAVTTFKTAINAANNARQERRAKAGAVKTDNAK